MDKAKTGQLIKNAREQKGYTQQELGDIVGVTNKAVSRWEKGESFPDVGILESLAAALDIKIDELIIGESVPKESMALRDAMSIMKLQRRERRRQLRSIVWLLACAVLMIFRVYISGFTSHGGIQIPLWTDVVIMSLICGIIMWLGVLNNDLAEPKYAKIYRRVSAVWYIFSVYVLLLHGYLLTAAYNRKFLLGMDVSHVGPFIYNQFRFVMVVSLIAVLFLVCRTIRGEKMPYITLFILAVMFECCDLADLLFNMIDLDGAVRGFVIVAITYVVCMLIILIPLRLLTVKRKTKEDQGIFRI